MKHEYNSKQFQAISELLTPLNTELLKIDDVTSVFSFGPLASPQVSFSINVNTSSAAALYNILRCFYYGTAWYCRVDSTLNTDICQLHVSLDISDYDLADLKREIDYKVCLLKNASVKRKEVKHG